MVRKETLFVDNYKVIIITSGKLEQNCYLVKHFESADMLLIDPGGAVNEVKKAIEEEGGQLKLVLLTHGHFDHVGGVKPICDHYNLPFWLHSGDVKLLKRAPIYSISMEKRVIEISSDYKHFDGPVVDWGGDQIDIINTPGHTPGSVCFSLANMVFTGDIILKEQKVKVELPGFNNIDLSSSVENLLFNLPAETHFFPGHGYPDSIGNIRLWWQQVNPRIENMKIDNL